MKSGNTRGNEMKRIFGKNIICFGSRRKFGKESLLTICAGDWIKYTNPPHRSWDNGGNMTGKWFSLPPKYFLVRVTNESIAV